MIQIKSFVFNPIQVNTFVLYAENNECIIIDPGCYYKSEFEKLYAFIDESKLHPIAMIATHFHFDHVMGCAEIAKKYNIGLYGHKDYKLLFRQLDIKKQSMMFDFNFELPPFPEKALNDNDEIFLGTDIINVIHVPGHSPCGIALYIKESNMLLSGDILFDGSIGRSDLYMGDMDLLVSGIRSKILSLPDNTVVYCGHGFDTTIGKERISNPFL
jgi:hydroxyacylglutathione hydrolase